ncbi:MAG: polyprenyl diphosphate synthase [Promethearchaeota archaeon]
MEKIKSLDKNMLPKHIGLILDGNRRWAKQRNLDPNLGHLEGFKTLKRMLYNFFEAGIRFLSIYALSLENMKKRSKNELKYIYKLIKQAVDIVIKEPIVKKEKIRFRVIGKLSLLPKDVLEKIKQLHDFTKNHNRAFLNVCIMYDGREEIVDAIKKIIKDQLKPEQINSKVIKDYLYTSSFPELDYIIRTGMEDGARISGFLLWDSSYAEFRFRDDYWPDYNEDMLFEDLKEYIKRNRRRGK